MSTRPVQGNMAPPQPCYTSVPPRVVSDSSSSNMSISAPYFFESNNCNNKDAAVEKYEVLSDISADDHQHIFMEEDEEPPVVVVTRTQVVGVGGNNCNNNPDEVFSLSFALPPKEKSSASSACMSVDEVLPADPPLQAENYHHHHHALPSSNEQQLEVLVHPVTPTYERKKHLFQDQHQHQHQCCEHHEDHTKCVFRCCHGSSAAPAQCPAQVPLPSFGSNASYTRNHYDDHNRRNCSDKDQAIYETKTTDFPVAPMVSRTTSSNVRRMSKKSSRSRIREDYYYSSSNSHASTSIPRCVYVTSDVGSHHHGSASRHRRTMSSSTCVSISTMENIDDEGWDANKRRMFFDQQRREQAKSVVAQEIRYYVGQLSPFPKRKLNRNVELKRCNGCLA